jgi:hypothetical protein
MLFGALALLCVSTSPAVSQGLRILDCSGRTRAQHLTEVPVQYVVLMQVVDGQGKAAAGARVKLVGAKGTSEATVSPEGVAEFPDVDSGVWLMGADTGGLYYHEIALKNYKPGFWIRNGEIVAVAAAVSAVAVAAVVIANQTRGNASSDGVSGRPDCQTCNPGEDAPSIPGFQ